MRNSVEDAHARLIRESGIKDGMRVRITRAFDEEADLFFHPFMGKYVGKEGEVVDVGRQSIQVQCDAIGSDNGAWWWPIYSLQIIKPPIPKLPKVDGHEVAIAEDRIQVGCTGITKVLAQEIFERAIEEGIITAS